MASFFSYMDSEGLATMDEAEKDCGNDTEVSSCSVQAEYVGYMYVYTPICICGIILNILNLLVLSKRTVKLNQSTFTFFFGVALMDLSYLVLASPIGFVRCLPHEENWERYARNMYENFVFLPIVNTFGAASVWLTMIVSAERYMFVKHTQLAKRVFSAWSAKCTILVVFLLALAINFPYFFYRTLDDDGYSMVTDFGNSDGFQQYMWVRISLTKYFPIVVVAVVNALLVFTLCTARRCKVKVGPLSDPDDVTANGKPAKVSVAAMSRGAMATKTKMKVHARRQRQQMRLSAMMISISVVFLLCHMVEPFSHSRVFGSLFGWCALDSMAYKTLRVVTNILEMFSFASNFVFFCIFHRQFSYVLFRMFCHCLKVKPFQGEGRTALEGTAEAGEKRMIRREVLDETTMAIP